MSPTRPAKPAAAAVARSRTSVPSVPPLRRNLIVARSSQARGTDPVRFRAPCKHR
ncbi:MAG TPA: hypothetical protein VFH47_02070 [Candidatus Thermoplasmatota archaeon]|nr:hypothetical protein [Candidatus Thermoplasmatota archaeon]